MAKYIPLFESQALNKEERSIKNSIQPQNESDSIESNKSDKKMHLLQAQSKLPHNTPKNRSEVKELYLQHSNLSDRFHVPPEPKGKELLISFKKP